MGAVAKKIGVKVCTFLIADAIAGMIWKGIKNRLDGKTVFGKKIEQHKKTYVDWNGNVILGNQDGWVV